MPGKAMVYVSQDADSAALTAGEEAQLSKLEQAIERNVAGFVELGLALMEIRDQRLYRATHATFEEYCTERWDMSKPYAHRNICAAQVAQQIADVVPIGTESIARELVPLLDQPKVLARVAKKLAAAPKLTAAVAHDAVFEAVPEAAKRPKAPKTTPEEWREVFVEGLRGARLSAEELGFKKLAGQVQALLKVGIKQIDAALKKEAGRARK